MEGSIKELSRYRWEASTEAYEDAIIMLENGRYKNALNRSYYSIFHAIRAVNVLDEYDSSKHSGVIAYFNQNYVKTELFPKELSKIIRKVHEYREKADYTDFYIASKSEAEKQITLANEFRSYIETYLVNKGILDRIEDHVNSQ